MSGPPPLWVGTSGVPPDQARETFVLLHGFGGSSFSWRYWTPWLARRGHVVLVDLKGFGRAPKPDDDEYSPGHFAELVLRLIQARGLRDVTLVGHSLGGGVALAAALSLQSQGKLGTLKRMVLLAGAAFPQRLPPFVTLARHPRVTTLLLRLAGTRLLVAQALRSMVFETGSITTDQVEGYAAPMAEPGAARAMLQAALQIVPTNLAEMVAGYPALDLPTLLLWGRQDRVVPLWVAERLDASLPQSVLHVIERCGHLPAEERPEESLRVLARFLDAPSAGRT